LSFKHHIPLWRTSAGNSGVVYLAMILLPFNLLAETEMPEEIIAMFENKCAFSGCHAGPSSGNNLDLTEESAYNALVAQPSEDFPEIPLVKPGEPLNSYLMMKLVGVSSIKGAKMPKGDEPLSRAELRAIASWIQSLPKTVQVTRPKQVYQAAFPGLSLSTLQTAQTMPAGSFSYRIAHRWLGSVDNGFGQFFGLDPGSHVLTEFAFAFGDGFTFTAGRSGSNATFEFHGKLRLMRERTSGSVPISLALFAGVDWLTIKQLADPNNPSMLLSRTSGERFSYYSQLIASKKISNRLAVMLSPGLLLNGNATVANENAVFTLGYGIRYIISDGFSVFVEGVPILSGDSSALPVGGLGTQNGQTTVFDAFTLGLEKQTGGHIFHVYITNSLGLTPSQIMNGGELDFSDGKFRLGFNIYRSFRMPF
jgi:hypothetical protein